MYPEVLPAQNPNHEGYRVSAHPHVGTATTQKYYVVPEYQSQFQAWLSREPLTQILTFTPSLQLHPFSYQLPKVFLELFCFFLNFIISTD